MESQSAVKESRAREFIGSLLALEREQNREALAHLRGNVRGTSSDRLRAAKYIAPYLGDRPAWEDRWFYTVGGLFAYHPSHVQNESGSGPSLGAALGYLRGESGSMDQRFLALVGTSAEALEKPLFQAISLLRANGIGLNYFQLLRDLTSWGHPENYVQKRWAHDYFRSRGVGNDYNNESETTSDEN